MTGPSSDYLAGRIARAEAPGPRPRCRLDRGGTQAKAARHPQAGVERLDATGGPASASVNPTPEPGRSSDQRLQELRTGLFVDRQGHAVLVSCSTPESHPAIWSPLVAKLRGV
jgi:hypothetical protein